MPYVLATEIICQYRLGPVWWTYIDSDMPSRNPIWRGGEVEAFMPTFLWTAERTMDWDHWGFRLASR